METNKRLDPMDFSLTSYSKEELINELLIQRKEIAVLKNWKGDGFKPNIKEIRKKDNPKLNLYIKEGENVSEYMAFIMSLSVMFYMNGAIKRKHHNNFVQAFTTLGTTLNKCEWLLSKSLCVYLFEVLYNKEILHNHSDLQVKKNFGIKNSKRLRFIYHLNQNTHPINNFGVPRGYDFIDAAVDGALALSKDLGTAPVKFESPNK